MPRGSRYDVEPARASAHRAAHEIQGGNVARAKSTGRAEARKRYRQAASQPDVEDSASELDYGERKPDAGPGAKAKPAGSTTASSGRPGFTGAMRAAYHPVNLREDFRTLPSTLASRAFLAAAALVIGGAIAVVLFPNYTGTAFAYELLVLPGAALAPQLVAGFFAPRASYLLGLLIGLLQGLVYVLLLTQLAGRLGLTPLTSDQTTSLVSSAFLISPVYGMLFASAAAWYRRFLALSSPRRTAGGRPPAKGSSQKRATSRR